MTYKKKLIRKLLTNEKTLRLVSKVLKEKKTKKSSFFGLFGRKKEGF